MKAVRNVKFAESKGQHRGFVMEPAPYADESERVGIMSRTVVLSIVQRKSRHVPVARESVELDLVPDLCCRSQKREFAVITLRALSESQ
jgi:hypothetical protein